MVTVLPHPTYSPNLALCNLNFFGLLKDAVRRRCFTDNDELKHSVCDSSDVKQRVLHN